MNPCEGASDLGSSDGREKLRANPQIDRRVCCAGVPNRVVLSVETEHAEVVRICPLVPAFTCTTVTDGSYHVTQPASARR